MSGELKVDKISPSTNDGFVEVNGNLNIGGSLTVDGNQNLNADTIDAFHATAHAIDTDGEEETLATKGQVKNFVEEIIGNHGDQHDERFFQKSLWTSLLAQNGYTVLPTGLTLQWGRIKSNTDGDQKITFPKPFSSQCFSVSLTLGMLLGPITNTDFTINRFDSVDGIHDVCWIAVGI